MQIPKACAHDPRTMASRGGSAAQSQPPDENITAIKGKLYDVCKSHDPKKVFKQDDLLELGVIPNNDPLTLMKVAQQLCDEKLFKMLSDGSTMGWQVRSQDDAKKYGGLSYNQQLVYALIDESGGEGIWSKTLKQRTGLHDTLLRQAIKHLETHNMIADMKNVEHPTRKMYMKAGVQASERATGGPWYTDNELDEEFIEQMLGLLYNYIKSKSFYASSQGTTRKPKKGKVTAEEAKSLRDSQMATKVKNEGEDGRAAKRVKRDNLLPLPPGYQRYPTLHNLTVFIENSKVAATVLMEADIQQLLDVLCYDDRIEQVASGPDGVSYKAVRKSEREIEDGPSNGLTEAPCGRCPVFELCEEGGPVGPSNCVYFRDWLSI